MAKALIISAGMYRSASTLQFNILRVILEQQHGADNVYSCFSGQYNSKDPRRIHLVKTHKSNEQLANKAHYIFTAIRHPEEIKKSMLRRQEYAKKNPDSRFQSEMSLKNLPMYLSWWQFWAARAKFIQSYWMTQNLHWLVSIYIELLAYPLQPTDVLEQLESEMKVPAKDYDTKTLLHHGHITKKETDI